MKILILGATGRTGQWLLKSSLEKGYVVNVLVRDASKVQQRPKLNVFEGNADNVFDLKNAAQGCTTILSALNISRTSDFPWSPLRTPKTFLSDIMGTIIDLSKEQKIDRMIVCSAWGVGDTKKELPFWFRYTIDYSNIKFAYDDHQRQEKLLKRSDLSWTIVRPVGLTNSTKVGEIQLSYDGIPKPRLTISRKAVADFMVNAVEDRTLIGRCPVISMGL